MSKKEKFANQIDNNEKDGIKSLYLYVNGYNPQYYFNFSVTDYVFLAVFYLVAFAVSVWSAYLSFSCTWNGSVKNIYLRIFTALFAFILGPIYLTWYFFVNYLGKMC